MRYVTVAAALFVGTAPVAADELPKAVRVLEGVTTTFPAKSIPDGVTALGEVLESCHSMSDGTVKYTEDDLNKARKGEHVRFVFPKPLKVTILGEKLEASEVIYAEGVFWLVCGKEKNIVRCSKYTHDKWDPFLKWHRQTLPPDGRG